MCALDAERLRHPEDIRLPEPSAQLRVIFARLNSAGAHTFAGELLDALETASQKGDLSYLNAVVESWYRSVLFLQKPGFIKRHKEARAKGPGPGATLSEARKKLRLS